jgi:hypothetical protein
MKNPNSAMQNTFFIKEPIANMNKNISLIILNQKQLRQGIDFAINSVIGDPSKSLILISLTMPGKEILSKVGEKAEKIRVIDAFSRDDDFISENSIRVNSSDLTGIQIAIEKSEKNLRGEKIILIDALNVLSIYNKNDIIGKFLHLFSNKTRIRDNSALIFCIKDSMDPDMLEMAKEFADKVYDYSDLFISTISLAESQA